MDIFCQYCKPVCYLFIACFGIILWKYHTKFNKQKHISVESCLEKGLLLLSEQYRYEVVGGHNMLFSQLTWALLRGKQLCGGLSLHCLKYLLLKGKQFCGGLSLHFLNYLLLRRKPLCGGLSLYCLNYLLLMRKQLCGGLSLHCLN